MKKFELIPESMIEFGTHKLFRIRALIDFSDVKAGDIGGFVEKEANLSQEGNCWIYDDAKVYGNARVSGNARIFDDATVYGSAVICDNARVFRYAWICDCASIRGNAKVYDGSIIRDHAQLNGYASVHGKAKIYGISRIDGFAEVYGNAMVSDDARVSDTAEVSGNSCLRAGAFIESCSDYIVIGPIGSRDDDVTFYKTETDTIMVAVGCFNGTIDEFLDQVSETHGDSKYATTYRIAAQLAMAQLMDEKEENLYA